MYVYVIKKPTSRYMDKIKFSIPVGKKNDLSLLGKLTGVDQRFPCNDAVMSFKG